jgi:hypothetical protein
MKYVAKIAQPQYIRIDADRKITISPNGGEMADKDAELVKASPYGKRLIEGGLLSFAEVPKSPGGGTVPADGNIQGSSAPAPQGKPEGGKKE